MNSKMKKVLVGFASLLVAVALIAIAPVSRLVYAIYDSNRTNTILRQMEEEANAPEGPAVNDFHKQAYMSASQETDGSKTVDKIDLLVLTSDSAYELTYYERIVEGASSYTSEYFHMTGTYTRDGNMLTVEPGIGVLSLNPDGTGFTHYNAQYLTAEEAAGEKTRDEVYAMRYDSREIALMQDGSFVVGGKSDAKEELPAPEGRRVYTDAVLQGRVTYKTLITLDDNTYILYSHATNSNNVEQTTGSLFGYGDYVIKDTDKGIVPDESAPEQTYDIVSGEPGLGFMYANNNGSHMQFDLQSGSGFSQWLATSFNAPTPTFYVTESGFTVKLGALKTPVAPWGLYIPAADSQEQQGAQEEPAAESLKLEIESSMEGKPFVLEFKADGTLVTGWTNYEQTMLEGKWAFTDGTLVLDMEYTSTVAENADGGLDVTVNYGQMGEKTYSLTAGQAAALKGGEAAEAKGVTLEIETSVEGKPFILQLNADGTLLTGWTNHEQTMKEGKWTITDGTLVLDMEYTSTVAENAEGGLDVTVNYGQMGEKTYTLTAELAAALKGSEAPAAELVKLEIASSTEGKPFILYLNADGTLLTGWTNYEQTLMAGTWTMTDGALMLDMEYGSTVAENAQGGLDVTVNYGQMGEKTYSMTADQAAALKGGEAEAAELVKVELETSVEGKPFVLQFNTDGTLVTGWTNYEQTMQEGKWSAADGALVLEMAYESTVAENAQGGLDVTVNYGQMGEKIYTLTADQAAALLGGEAEAAELVKVELETSVEGKPFVLQFNTDGTLVTGWTNYEQTMQEGKWSAADGALVLEMAYEATVSENAEGGLDVTVNYGQMGEKVYTLTTDQVKLILN